MPSQSGEVEDISAAHGGEEKEEEKESLETPHDASFLIYLMEGINGPSIYKILLKSLPFWSIIFHERGDRDDDFKETEGLF
jgi:hypothetical protein